MGFYTLTEATGNLSVEDSKKENFINSTNKNRHIPYETESHAHAGGQMHGQMCVYINMCVCAHVHTDMCNTDARILIM